MQKFSHMFFKVLWRTRTAYEDGGQPRYETLDLTKEDKDGKLKLFLSKDGRHGSIQMKANADVYAANLDGDQSVQFEISDGHKAWVQVALGEVEVNGMRLQQGDGLAIPTDGLLEFTNGKEADFVFFDFEAEPFN